MAPEAHLTETVLGPEEQLFPVFHNKWSITEIICLESENEKLWNAFLLFRCGDFTSFGFVLVFI